jgi:hypothetical protein
MEGALPPIKRLPRDAQIAICAQLWRLFPPDADLRHDEGHYSPTPKDDVEQFRNSLLHSFAENPTVEDLQALDRLAGMVPEEKWIRVVRRRAESNRTAMNYHWLSAKDFSELFMAADRRLVRSDEELLEACLETLKKFQLELRGARPTVRRLWNEGKEFSPKDEAALSDEIAAFFEEHLARKGVLANREVEIRPRVGKEKGGGKAQETDILVQARDPDTGCRYQVIVEVKGCWNVGVLTDIKDQLIDRYLAENQCRHGIYVVGWYLCPQWSTGDYRYARSARHDLDGLSKSLRQQAEALGASNGITVRSVMIDARLP